MNQKGMKIRLLTIRSKMDKVKRGKYGFVSSSIYDREAWLSMNEYGAVKSCKQCGKIYAYAGIGELLCEKCKEIDNKEFESVKEYIYSNPDATIRDTAEVTGVRVRRITAYIRENRLIIPDKSAVFILCETCGESIKSGRICKKCADALSMDTKKELNIEMHHIGETPNRKAVKMHYINHSSI